MEEAWGFGIQEGWHVRFRCVGNSRLFSKAGSCASKGWTFEWAGPEFCHTLWCFGSVCHYSISRLDSFSPSKIVFITAQIISTLSKSQLPVRKLRRKILSDESWQQVRKFRQFYWDHNPILRISHSLFFVSRDFQFCLGLKAQNSLSQ